MSSSKQLVALAWLSYFVGMGCGISAPAPANDAGSDPGSDELADLPKAEVKSSLELRTDSFSFPNFAGKDPQASVTPKLAARMFGSDGVCAAADAEQCRPTPVARTWTQNINLSMEGGRCEGFAVLSALFSLGELNPSDFGAESANQIDVDGNEQINREIAYWFSTQYLPVVRDNTRRMTAVQTLKLLAEEFAKPKAEADMFRIGMVRVDESGRAKGGHAVMPYAIVPGSAAGQYAIKIYDNNHPQEERAILVDATTNTWQYQASSNPDEAAALYRGSPADDNQLYLASVRARLGVQPCPFCSGSEADATQYFSQVFTLGSATTVVEDDDGQQAGMVDGRLVNTMPDAKVVPGYSVQPWLNDFRPVVNVPSSQRLKFRVTGNANKDPAQLTVVGRGYVAGVEGANIQPGNTDELTLESGGLGVQYVPSAGSAPTLFAALQSANGSQTMVRVPLPANVGLSSVSIAISPQSGDVVLAAKSDSGTDLTIEVTRSSSASEDLFEGTIVAPMGGTVGIGVENWSGDGAPIDVQVDEDGDGIPEKQVEIDDAMTALPPPAAPEQLRLVSVAHDLLELAWADLSDNEAGVVLERDAGDGFVVLAELPANTTSYADASVKRATAYRYRVRSWNEIGSSDWSNVLQLSTPDCPDGTQDADNNNTCLPNCETSGLTCGAHGQCSAASGVATCVCEPTHTGSSCSQCAPGYQDHDSDGSCSPTCVDAGLDCGAHGTCSDAGGTTVCDCAAGYGGAQCDACVVGYQDNDNNGSCEATCAERNLNCGDHGSCSDASGSAVCVCEPGYEGETCGLCPADYQDNDDNGTCSSTCAASGLDCGDQGVCADSSGTAVCECTPGHEGPTCTQCASGYQDNDGNGACNAACSALEALCGTHGACADGSGAALCSCDLGYAGEACDRCASGYQDADDDGVCELDCATTMLDCGEHGACSDSDGSADCACAPGYAGGHCESCAAGFQDRDLDGVCQLTCEGSGIACGMHGMCIEDLGFAACLCDAGYDGTTCELCASGFQDNDADGTCLPDCVSSGLTCAGHGVCDDSQGVAGCQCDDGYAGVETCEDIDECQTDHGGCGDPQYYTCTNNPGAAPTCADIDECQTNNGGCGSATFYTCTNNPGATPTCADIDECQTNNGGCGSATFYTCTNNPGAAPTCADIDECQTNNGGCGSATFYTCTNNPGAAPTCADIDECQTNNGGCGSATFYTCTNNPGAAPTCADIDECQTNNGGCGSATFYTCTNNPGAAPTCADIDECQTNNGECGSATFYTCTNNPGAAPTCADIDECQTNNGGCGNATFYSCTNNSGAAPTCADIDECQTNNGGCGSATFFSCTNNSGAAPTCADINECQTNNGGCGSATFFSCTNNSGSAPTCVDIDECQTNNGGCGSATFYSCTNNSGAAPTCADIDECLTNNGGCGDPLQYSCTNNPGAAPTCALLPSCGDGGVDPGESCDDGDTTDGDGCSSSCTVELAHYCFGAPSTCVWGACADYPLTSVPNGSNGLAVDGAATASASGIIMNPRSSIYTTYDLADPVLIQVDMNWSTNDIAFLGARGSGLRNATFANEPGNSVWIRIHNGFSYQTDLSTGASNYNILDSETAPWLGLANNYRGTYVDDGTNVNFMLAEQAGSQAITTSAQTNFAGGGKRGFIAGASGTTFKDLHICSGFISCADLHARFPSLPDGTYTIDSDGAGGASPVATNCNMSGGAGAPTPTFLWLDATDASTITKDGSNHVTEWRDKSGLDRHASVPGGSSAPLWRASGIGDLPEIEFNGSNVRLQTAAVPTAAEMTVFIVFNWSTPESWGSLLNQNHDTYFSLRRSECCGGEGNLNWHIRNRNDAPVLPPNYGSYQLLTTMQGAGTASMYYDPAQISSTAEPNIDAGSDVITIGNAISSAQSMGGTIMEIRAYSTALSAPDRLAIENELKAKYRLGYTSCADILLDHPSAASGLYTIDPDGSGGLQPFTVYCDMTTDGGGWTLIGKHGTGAWPELTVNAYVDLIANPLSDVNPAALLTPTQPVPKEVAYYDRAKTNAIYHATPFAGDSAVRIIFQVDLDPRSDGTYFQQRKVANVNFDFWHAIRDAALWSDAADSGGTVSGFGSEFVLSRVKANEAYFIPSTNTVNQGSEAGVFSYWDSGATLSVLDAVNGRTPISVSRHFGLICDGVNLPWGWIATSNSGDGRFKNDSSSTHSTIWLR